MEWSAISDIGGWGVLVIAGIEFLRRLIKGDIVLGREFEMIRKERDELRADVKSSNTILADQTTAIRGLTEAVKDLKSGGHP